MKSGGGFEVKKLTIDVGERVLSHRHFHCFENWVVVRGVVRVLVGGDEVVLNSGEGFGIKRGVFHELENCGRIPAEVVEVRVGDYFGGDDCEAVGMRDEGLDISGEEFCVGPECGKDF